MPDDFADDEGQEFLGEVGVKVGLFGQLFQPCHLMRLAVRVRRRQVMLGLQLAHRLRMLEPFGQRVDQNGIQPVNRLAMLFQHLGGAGARRTGCGAAHLGLKKFSYPFELEGGGIEVSGDGLLLTTEAVQNNPNRAEGRDDAAFHAAIRDGLAIDELLWIGEGLANDDTDGHIDNLARFIAPRTILAVSEADKASPNCAPMQENLKRLREMRPRGQRLDIIELPLPKSIRLAGRDLPPSHAIFLIVNGGVLVPLYGQDSDKIAMGIVGDCFPGRKIVGIDCRLLLIEGGALHCLSQQQPADNRVKIWPIIEESLRGPALSAMLLGLALGIFTQPESVYKSFYDPLFRGLLSVLMLVMGMEAWSRVGELRKVAQWYVVYSVVAPFIHGLIAFGLGMVAHYATGFSWGGVVMLAVIASSSSDISGPPTLRAGIPSANPSAYIGASTAIGTPVAIGLCIPFFVGLAQALSGG